MKEEINKNPLNQTPNPEFLEKRIFELRRRAFGLIHSFVTGEWQWPKSVKGDKKRNFIDKLVEGTTKIVPEATDEIKTRFETLNAIDEIKDLESLLKKATEIHIELLTKYLSLEELEKRLRDRAIQGKGYQELSRGLCFEIIENQAVLHIPITFFENAKSFLESFKEGLRVLANKMITEKELADIREVIGYSSLVQEKHRILATLGFEVILDVNGKLTEKTKISREKLLELYGPKKL